MTGRGPSLAILLCYPKIAIISKDEHFLFLQSYVSVNSVGKYLESKIHFSLSYTSKACFISIYILWNKHVQVIKTWDLGFFPTGETLLIPESTCLSFMD